MKKLVIFIVLLQSSNAFGCGGGSNIMDIAGIASAIIVVMCSITLPLSCMLYSKVTTVKNIILISFISILGIIISFLLAIKGSSMESRAAVIFLTSISMFFPSAFFFFKAVIKQSRKT